MSKIFVKDRDGGMHELPAENGLTLMEIIRDAGLDIEAACGGPRNTVVALVFSIVFARSGGVKTGSKILAAPAHKAT